VPKLRREFASFLAIGDRMADIVVRFGAGLSCPNRCGGPWTW